MIGRAVLILSEGCELKCLNLIIRFELRINRSFRFSVFCFLKNGNCKFKEAQTMI